MSSINLIRAASALLALSLPGALLGPAAEAQRDAVRAQQQPPAAASTPSAAATAVNPDVVALLTTSDLVIKELGFTGKGEITFRLSNRGSVPINMGPRDGPGANSAVSRTTVPENQQIKVDVYVGTAPFRSVFQPQLEGKSSKTFTLLVPEAIRPRCAQSRFLKTVIDAGRVIVEYSDTNNIDTVIAARPVPTWRSRRSRRTGTTTRPPTLPG